MKRAEIVCLLPVRNAASDVPGYLDCVGTFCDAVVALDDGSTDDTRRLLSSSPRVALLLSNPQRQDHRNWDDAANRNRLLEAAGALRPKWILSLDGDERIDPDDAVALRDFLATDAVAGCAYGFQHYRMWGAQAYDPVGHWIYRLFAFSPGQVFPQRRLHFNPVPTSIRRRAWVRTTIRVQHFGAMDEMSRQRRLRKYAEADPRRAFGRNVGGMDGRPARLARWRRRPSGLQVLVVD